MLNNIVRLKNLILSASRNRIREYIRRYRFLSRVRKIGRRCFDIKFKDISHYYLLSRVKKAGLRCLDIEFKDNQYTACDLENLQHMIACKNQFLQFEIPFDKAKFLIVEFTPDFGFGACFQRTLRCLAYGYLFDRTVIIDTKAMNYDFPYEPIGIYSMEDIRSYLPKKVRANFLPQSEKLIHLENYYPFSRWMGFLNTSKMLLPLANNLKKSSIFSIKFSTEEQKYIDGYMLSFFKLHKEYENHLEECKRRIGFTSPIIGLHIRQGDTLTVPKEMRRGHSVKDHLRMLEYTISKTGIKTVFVATDSNEALQQLPKDSDIKFIYDDQEQRYNNWAAKMLEESQDPVLKKQETMTAVRNLYLLSECDYILGGGSAFLDLSSSIAYYRTRELKMARMIKPNSYRMFGI